MTVDWSKPLVTEKGWTVEFLRSINDSPSQQHAEYVSVVTEPTGNQFISFNSINGYPFLDSGDPRIINAPVEGLE